MTSQFASGAEGGPQGEVVALADLNDLQVELDIAQDDFAKLSAHQKGHRHGGRFSRPQVRGRDCRRFLPRPTGRRPRCRSKVQILNPDSYLRPEMNATVKFLAEETQKAASSQPSGVFVPTAAVRDQDGKKVVFIAFNDKALMREVRIHLAAQRRISGERPGWRRERHHRRASDSERRRQNQD